MVTNCRCKRTLDPDWKQRQVARINEQVPPVLKLLELEEHEYMLVGSAAEALAGVVRLFADIDIVVRPETFQRLLKDGFLSNTSIVTRGCECNRIRTIKVGNCKIIEANTLMWFDKLDIDNPIADVELNKLSITDMIEWRIWMGRTKDLLRAWELVYLFENSIPTNLLDMEIYVKPILELCKQYRIRLSQVLSCD